MKYAIAILALGVLAGCGEPPCRPYPTEAYIDGSFWVNIDQNTGCAYVRPTASPHTNMTPMMDRNGRQVCYAPRECPTQKDPGNG